MTLETFDTIDNQQNKVSDYLFWILSIMLAILYIRGFFWADDGRIIFQVVENLYHGLGPVYTEGDRVQVHTSSIWTYYMLFFRFFTSNYKVIVLLASIIPFAFIVIWFRAVYRRHSFLLLITLFLSNVLFSYWGSGLGNPLTYLLLTVLFYAFIKENTKLFIFIAALMLANRLDAITYIAPFSAFFILKHSFKQNLINFIKFGWPFYLHLLFAFIYFGSIFPNSYYAKIDSVGISMMERILTFVKYHWTVIYRSPLDFLFLLSPFLLFFIFREEFSPARKAKAILSLIACFLVQFYVFWIGSDHLHPRLLGVPMFLSLLVIIEFYAPLIHKDFNLNSKSTSIPVILTFIILIAIAGFSTFIPLKKLDLMDHKDHRGGAAKFNNSIGQSGSFLVHDAQMTVAHNRLTKREEYDYLTRPKKSPHLVSFVAEAGTILKVGSNVHMVDYMGLGDPLMSRIKTTQKHYAPGHNYRPIPRGYPETLMEGTNKIIHPEIAAYYDKLKHVISGKLFSASRFKDIFYLMTHELPVDPNHPENARYFLSPEAYEQIFKEDYGIETKLIQFGKEEFNFYGLNGKKTDGFLTNYWTGSALQPETEDTPLSRSIAASENTQKLLTSGPYQVLRPGRYSFEIDYISAENKAKTAGEWKASIWIGEEHLFELKNGSLYGTEGQHEKVSGTFSIAREQDMAKMNLQIFANAPDGLLIEGIRLTKLVK